MRTNLYDIKTKIEFFANLIDAPDHLLPSIGGPSKETEVILDTNGYLCIVFNDWRNSTTTICYDDDDLLFRVFYTITHFMAYEYAKSIKTKNDDFTSLIYNKQEELMGKLNIEWKTRLEPKRENNSRNSSKRK